ncbi:MAG: SusC/RagA family TonB-linked outer membrane protein, partial [Flavipsychrobacter sp.]
MKKYVQEDFLDRALLFMKWTTLLMAVIITTALSAVAKPATGQELLLKKITIEIKALPLPKALEKISTASGVKFTYSGSVANSKITVNANAKGVELKKVLDDLFRDYPYTYEVFNDEIIIHYDAEKNKSHSKKAESSNTALSVIGKIVDEKGNPLSDVTITIKGTTIMQHSDQNGFFSIATFSSNSILVFSHIGYKTQEIPITTQHEIKVVMEQDLGRLDEVHVIGYGITTQRLNTGSTVKISAADIEKQNVGNPLTALEGRVPGMFIETASGSPGAGINVQIRGLNSISAGTSPLYIIDGVPFNNNSLDQLSVVGGGLSPFNSINPADIESIEILKDADATAIYGSRGANGVVLVTTKKGKIGKTALDVNLNTGAGTVGHFVPMLNIDQYLQLRKAAFSNDGITADVNNAPDLLSWSQTQNTDWQKKLIGGTASITDAEASISGGDKNTRFIFSGGYRTQGTVYPGSASDDRASGRLSVDHTSNDNRFNALISVNYSYDDNNLLPDITGYINLPPNFPVNDAAGNYNWAGNLTNPYAFLLAKSNNQTYNFIANSSLKYSLFKNFSIKTNLGYTSTDLSQVQVYPEAEQNPAYGPSAYSIFGNNKINTWIIEPQIDYSVNIGKGVLQALIGGTWQQSISIGNYSYAANFPSEALLESEAAAGFVYRSDSNTDYRYNSVFGRINYNWDDKYILNITARRDGSSRFGPGKQFGNFGAVGAAWIFSEESFFKNKLSFLSFGKLRGSYGLTGNDQISDYQYLSTYGSNGIPYQGPTLTPTKIANPDYSWETNRKLEAALELGFLKNSRILISIDYYNNRSGNQLINYAIAGQSGFTSYQANLPATVQNTGWEFTLRLTNIKTDNFSWTTTGNLTIQRNKLLSFPNLAGSSYATANLVVGQPLALAWGYNYLGVNPQTGSGNFQDIDKSGNISYPGDYKNFGSTLPKYYGGIGNTLRYRHFQLDFFFVFVNKIAPSIYNQLYVVPGSLANVPSKMYAQMWQKPGDIAALPKASTQGTDSYNNYLGSYQGKFDNGSYIKLSNLSLSFDFPNSLCSALKLQSAKIFLRGQNLFTITNYSGYDPEA